MHNTDNISKFSHEIRNPLTLIYSSLQLLEKECPAVGESTLWPQIMQDMLDVIHLLKEMSSSFGTLTKAEVTIFEVLSETAASFVPASKLRNIQFTTEISDKLSTVVITADRSKLREALMNLLLNAADAVSELPRPGKITLSAVSENDVISIHIKDNGPGIPSERLSTLFDSFVTYKANGTGLGLGITKAIIEQHGGSISVDTCTKEPETYTDFCLKLPYE